MEHGRASSLLFAGRPFPHLVIDPASVLMQCGDGVDVVIAAELSRMCIVRR